MSSLIPINDLREWDTRRVLIHLIYDKEIAMDAPESKWSRFWRRLLRRPIPQIIKIVKTPVTIQVTAGFEDKGHYANLWMTAEEVVPLIEQRFSVPCLLLPVKRPFYFQVGKSDYSFVD